MRAASSDVTTRSPVKPQRSVELKHPQLILSKGFVIIRVKSFGDFISLSDKDSLLTTLDDQLKQIENKFPTKPNRYIEIEL